MKQKTNNRNIMTKIEKESGTKSAANECYTGLPMNTLYNMDCMDGMALFPDKFFDLAIVDPPYGIDNKLNRSSYGSLAGGALSAYSNKRWDSAPTNKYFKELKRVSKNQIVFGGNYFTDNLKPSRCWICWNKDNAVKNFSSIELAWTSFDALPDYFYYAWGGLADGILGRNKKEKSIHPTQKPRALYRWILSNYAENCETILDTHAGSCSSCIEFEIGGFEWIAFEKDTDYFNDAKERMKRELAQTRLDLQV